MRVWAWSLIVALVGLGCAPGPQPSARMVLPTIWDLSNGKGESEVARAEAIAEPAVVSSLVALVEASPGPAVIEAGRAEISLEVPAGSVAAQLAGGKSVELARGWKRSMRPTTTNRSSLTLTMVQDRLT